MKKIIVCILFFLMCVTVRAADEVKPFSVILDWFINPNHAPLFVAEQEGFFKKGGLKIKWIIPADPADPPKLVAAGKVDLAIDYQIHLKLAQSKGLALVQVGTLIPTPLNCLVVLDSSHIESLKDFKAKKIAYSSPAIDLPLLKIMLEHAGLTLNDVTLINVHYGLTQALLLKKVDGTIGMMRNFELIQLAELGQKTKVFFPEEHGVKAYQELIFVSRPEHVNDEKIKSFMAAIHEGISYLKAHPEESWKKFVKQHPELNNKLNRDTWYATIPKF